MIPSARAPSNSAAPPREGVDRSAVNLTDSVFHTASDDDIKAGRITDVYFERAVQVLRAQGTRKQVAAEVRTTTLPADWPWGVLAGVEEVARLLEGLPVSVRCYAEGTLFHAGEPVLDIEGEYTDFAVYETPLLGFLCQASGVATKAARCRLAAGDRPVISFGARRMHPAIAPMVERAAYLGGCDGVAVLKSAEVIGGTPMGTMPHALILVMGDAAEAFRAFDAVMPPEVPRVALIDTLEDEKFGALTAARALGEKLEAVRFDTPGSRRGDFLALLQETRWELDRRGFQRVQFFVSGGVDEDTIRELNPLVHAYGVGTAICNAPVMNFALDIVEVEGEAFAKRGKESGRKEVWRCRSCHATHIAPRGAAPQRCSCGGALDALLQPLIENGTMVADLPDPKVIRDRVLEQLARHRADGTA